MPMKRSNRALLPALAFAGLAVLPSFAAAEAPRFPGLLPPEIVKGDWNQRGLIQADVDGDRRVDLLFLNNDKARVEILLQRKPGENKPKRAGKLEGRDRWTPVLEDSRFEAAPLTTSTFMYDLAAGDLDGDGRTDLVITEKSNGLQVFYQREPGRWSDPVKLDLKDVVTYLGLLHVFDVDGNGRPEIVSSTAKTLYFHEADAKGALREVRKLNHSEENLHGLRFVDVDGDGRTDLQLCSTDRQYSLRIRRQEAPGQFGPELMIRQEQPEGILSVDRLAPGQSPFFAMLQKASGMIELFRLGPARAGAGGDSFSIEAFSAPVADKDKSVLTAWGDLDGNGRPDLVVSDAAAARVHLYLQDEQGRLSASLPYPSFAAISSLATGDLDGNGTAEVYLCSTTEEILGAASLNADKRLEFPVALPFQGVPTAVAVADWRGPGQGAVACAGRLEKKNRLVFFDRATNAAWRVCATAEVASVTHDIERILPVDLNQDGRLDLVLAASFKPLVFLLQTNTLAFAEVKDLSGYSKSLVSKVSPSGLAVDDIDGDGKPELLVTRKGFVRALRLNDKGQLEVVDQLNASDPEVEVDAVFGVPGPDGRDFLLADSAHNCFEVLARNEQKIYSLREKIQLPNVKIKGGAVFTDRDGRATVFLSSDDKFWRVRLNQSTLSRERIATYETDLPEVEYGGIELGDLNADGRPDIVAVDTTRTRVLEVLSLGEDMKPVSQYHFQVFEADPGMRQQSGGREPKELILGDFTGDGKTDIAILVHDRLLMYPQP